MVQTDIAVPFWRMDGISKHYGGVRALENVGLTLERGRIHAVLGENGAGKSTLIKIMSGVVQPDSGTMELENKPVRFEGPAEAMRSGVVCHLPGIVIGPRSYGRREHLRALASAPVWAD